MFLVLHFLIETKCAISKGTIVSFITPQPLKAVWVLFSHMASGWVDEWAVEKGLSLSCISEAVRYRKLVLCRDIG